MYGLNRILVRVDAQHHLTEATWRSSPHCDERPEWACPELIVLHCVSLPEGQFGTDYPQALFMGTLDCSAHADFADLAGVEVAPHLLIDRNGGVDQFVAFDQRAWHAGASCWRGRPGCNSYSIGVELEGVVAGPYTLAQYDALADVLSALFARYEQLSADAIVGHNEIAPGRKQDPGAFFDWRGVLMQLQQRAATLS